MTRIDFYTDVADARQFACRAAQTVYRKGELLLIVLPDEAALQQFSQALWSFGDVSFIPHCQWQQAEAAVTPIWLAAGEFPAGAGSRVLLNLSPQMPAEPAGFSRILEVVGQDEASKTVARSRYRRYLDLGFDIHHHNMSATA